MKLGTPGFVGDRLREGREARGLTAVSLSEMLGVSKAAVSQYEKGEGTSPRPDVMEQITRVLNLPHHFFVRPPSQRPAPTIYWRLFSAATKTARVRCERRLQWIYEEILPLVDSYAEIPKVDFPQFPMPSDPTSLSFNEIETLASLTRRFWGLGDGPISNVIWLLENKGAIVAKGLLGADSLDAFSTWIDRRPFIFLGTDKIAACRSRFDAAHELAHLILHSTLDERVLNDPAQHKLIESQAHRFAGAFLIPADQFAGSFFTPSLDEFRSLKPTWKISIGAQIHRVEDLGILNQTAAQRLWRVYARNGWRKKEPLDDSIPGEEPHVLGQVIRLLIEQGVIGKEELTYRIPLSKPDIEDLVGLPSGYLNDAAPIVRLSDHKGEGRPLRTDGNSPATIIDLAVHRHRYP